MGQDDLTSDPVFLSASLPDPLRDEKYYGTADLVSIREATRALAAVVLPRTRLVFGGHPAITPLVRAIAQRLGRTDNVRVYQSAFFSNHFPADNTAFSDVVVTPAAADRDASLSLMRRSMIGESQFSAAVFIGGMDGIEDEYSIFAELQPDALVLPVASTGAAASIVFSRLAATMPPALQYDLSRQYTYRPLFRRLLGY